MKQLRHWVMGGVLVFGGLATVQPAAAVPLSVGNFLTIGGITVTVASCTYTVGDTDTPCDTNLELVASGAGPGVGVKIDSTIGPIFSAEYSDTATYDLSLGLLVSSSIGPITTITAGGGGSAYSDDLSLVGGGETVTPGGQNLTVDLTTTPASITLSTPLSEFRVDKDFGLLLPFASGPDDLVLDYFTQNFEVAPEPSSCFLLLAGLGGLIVLRRRR